MATGSNKVYITAENLEKFKKYVADLEKLKAKNKTNCDKFKNAYNKGAVYTEFNKKSYGASLIKKLNKLHTYLTSYEKELQKVIKHSNQFYNDMNKLANKGAGK